MSSSHKETINKFLYNEVYIVHFIFLRRQHWRIGWLYWRNQWQMKFQYPITFPWDKDQHPTIMFRILKCNNLFKGGCIMVLITCPATSKRYSITRTLFIIEITQLFKVFPTLHWFVKSPIHHVKKITMTYPKISTKNVINQDRNGFSIQLITETANLETKTTGIIAISHI